MESIYATPQEIQEQLLSPDIITLIKKLEVFAHGRIKSMGLSVEAIDIVHDVLLGIQEDSTGRNWNKATCPSFEKFLFGAVWGHIGNEYRKHKNSKVAANGHFTIFQSSSIEMKVEAEIDFALTKQEAISCLRELGADEVEEFLFECWCDGINKPRQVAEFLGVPVSTINNATKRLERKQPLIQERLNYHHHHERQKSQ